MKRLTIFLMFIAFASMYACDKDDTSPQPVKTDNQEKNDDIGDIPDNTIPVDIPHYIMGVVETNSYKALVSDDDLTVHIVYDTSDNRKYSFWYEIKSLTPKKPTPMLRFANDTETRPMTKNGTTTQPNPMSIFIRWTILFRSGSKVSRITMPNIRPEPRSTTCAPLLRNSAAIHRRRIYRRVRLDRSVRRIRQILSNFPARRYRRKSPLCKTADGVHPGRP